MAADVREWSDVPARPRRENRKAVNSFRAVFLNRRAAGPYRALAPIILGPERFSWSSSL